MVHRACIIIHMLYYGPQGLYYGHHNTALVYAPKLFSPCGPWYGICAECGKDATRRMRRDAPHAARCAAQRRDSRWPSVALRFNMWAPCAAQRRICAACGTDVPRRMRRIRAACGAMRRTAARFSLALRVLWPFVSACGRQALLPPKTQ